MRKLADKNKYVYERPFLYTYLLPCVYKNGKAHTYFDEHVIDKGLIEMKQNARFKPKVGYVYIGTSKE